MSPSKNTSILLSDYQAPAFWVDRVSLSFHLHPTATRVISKVQFRANPDRRAGGPHDLRLDGQELRLVSASIDGRPVQQDQLQMDSEGLTIPADLVPQDGFLWQCEVEINPTANTSLDGLYISNGMYCTQCEAQGFRKITYYPDRPDVMAVFDVQIHGDAPVLLSNGNPDGRGNWHDPWPKPAYLFALVAGDLVSYDDSFTTCSGRQVALQIFVRPGDEDKCAYAMDALKRSMSWDEEVYGREYDLDLFMIVAVDDFNMGAMENKGLNIFNSKFVLASPETATDQDFERIEGIIAHEYFHNWTGNRITCRDWFQLCLKEGLTVFRDQQFSGDQRSIPVKRIDDVQMLRGRQFREDGGPLAHPVRPTEYIEINNFYTATVYEKGAEVIGMLQLLVGEENYKKALDLYFERHDGQACTIEDWIKVFEDTTGRNLTQFSLWYSQAGTPRVHVSESFEGGTYTLNFTQDNPPTPGQTDKAPQVIPIRIGFLDVQGHEPIAEQLFILDQAHQSLSVSGFDKKPTPSLLRGFSAPVILQREVTNTERAFVLAHDSDPFNRWEAGETYAQDLLQNMVLHGQKDTREFTAAMRALVLDNTLDPAFRGAVLGLPSEASLAKLIADAGHSVDPDKIHSAHRGLWLAIAKEMADDVYTLYAEMAVDGPYSPDSASAGKRALRERSLALINRLEPDSRSAKAQFDSANNMTEQRAAFALLMRSDHCGEVTQSFYNQWRDNRLVMDSWFAFQIGSSSPADTLGIAKKMVQHTDFDWKNPNRFRSVIGPFSMHHAGFHRADGAGYAFLADWLLKLDPVNPQTTARMCSAFEPWSYYDTHRQKMMREQLHRIADTKDLSKNTAEIVGKILG
ncbi:MAG: aminopeptidase N [Rhodobacteraceae bacterium]|nr:aminopeptidase N [Paracoccaceae bacterium]